MSPSVGWGSVFVCLCVFGGMASTLTRQCQLSLILHFLLIKSLKVRLRWLHGAFSGVSWLVHSLAQPWACMQVSGSPWICWSFSKFLQTSSSFIFSSFLVNLWLPQLFPLHKQVNQFPLIVFFNPHSKIYSLMKETREREHWCERETWSVATCTCPDRDWICNLGMCPDRESVIGKVSVHAACHYQN